ncbi:winged helix-turn-helix domain-containing protein [Lysobacter brunescens]|uniref:Winged helix-turn-helix domain-containing protein n=1 Tax=Lysobacter brunescens TaxID=262323 RepID=A0ABW2YHX8_9GAMM
MTSSARPHAQPWPEHTTRLIVGDLRIDLPNRRVERPDGVRQELPQRVFDLLLVFLSEPGTVHSRDALFERVWHGVIVEDANLTQGIWMLRKAFGEERRQWFRTVSKTGYVFEPPDAVRVEDSEGESAARTNAPSPVDGATSHTAAPVTGEASNPTSASTIDPRPSTLHRTLAGVMAACVAVVTLALPVLSLPVLSPRDRADASAGIDTAASARKVAPPLRIHLFAEPPVVDARTPDGLWAAMLAEAWLGYKLELLPETLLMPPGSSNGAHLAPDERRITIRASVDPKRPDQILLQARIAGAARPASPALEVRGPAKDAVRLADALSQEVLTRLLPTHAHAPWPALPRDVVAARRYALAMQAARQHDWTRAEREADAAARAAPAFGPVRWLLAQLHWRRGDVPGAIELAAESRRASTPLPDDAERVFDAMTKTLDPGRREDTIAAFAELEKTWPGRIDFAIMRALMLTRVGRPAEALAAATHPPDALRALPVDVRIRQAIASSEATLLKGDPATSRRHAQAALALATAPGLDRERGSARLMLARTHHATPGNAPAPELFELAAESFAAGGEAPSSLYARFLADNIRLDKRPEVSEHLEPLIATARRLHNVGLEIEALRTTAYRFYRAGDHARFREYLRRAQDTANRSDDLNSQRIVDLDLMGEDFFMANISSARARIRRLRSGGLDGTIGYLVPLLDATMTLHEGRYRDALQNLRDGDAAGRQKPPAVVEANYACVRADILLAMMDTVAARPQIDRCRNLGNPSLRAAARMLDVQTDLADGDLESARIKLQGIEKDLASLATGVERWSLVSGIGYAFAAVGDYDRAERLLHSELDATRGAGYLLMVAGIETNLAEIAAARGDWMRSRTLGLSARRRLPGDAWLINQRLDRLDILDALVHDDVASARARMASLRTRAEALDDRLVLRDLRILASISSPGARDAASSEGIAPLDPAQVYIDWLYGRLPSQRATSTATR